MKFVRDLAERSSVAFVAAFAPLYTGFSAGEAAAYAGGAAAVTAAVGALAALFGAKGTPSLDPSNTGVTR